MNLKMSSVRWQPFCLSFNMSTHWGRVTHICVSYLCQHWLRKWLVTRLVPSHYLNQCWNIVSWTPRNKLQWNSNRNSYIFIQENPFENVVWKMAAILSQPRWVSIYEFHPENGQALLETKGIVINWFCESGTQAIWSEIHCHDDGCKLLNFRFIHTQDPDHKTLNIFAFYVFNMYYETVSFESTTTYFY